MTTLSVRVRNPVWHGGIVLFSLEAANGQALPPFQAGAHIDVHLPNGMMRQYSLCGDPADTASYRLGVLLDPASRGGSIALHEAVREGELLQIGVPRNLFPLEPGAQHAVLIGGGIGITPMVAMAYELHDRGETFELHYVVRAGNDAAFRALLDATPFAGAVRYHVRDPEGTTPRFDPQATIRQARARAAQPCQVYTCGPVALMQAVERAVAEAGLAPSCFHQEKFSGDPVTGGDTFEIMAARAGVRTTVGADETIVAALARAGVKIKTSCENGVCGTCLADVLEGVPEHRDEYLTEEERAENDQIVLCCSRSRSPLLVVDV
ncbi:PDR/VanB family oxidoreductase [Komagataeibacter xylinus]|uniref:Oxidoreductase n=1 Tax=Komagataeibacter xylinus TaxID=28448 RepID=A0A857FP99_KOMXY|nr:PDR/VanB family oxidoreductase [Komagataeibacter xylinus]QHC35996.1 oxidoreductase [Komagataeibacter xylinus]